MLFKVLHHVGVRTDSTATALVETFEDERLAAVQAQMMFQHQSLIKTDAITAQANKHCHSHILKIVTLQKNLVSFILQRLWAANFNHRRAYPSVTVLGRTFYDVLCHKATVNSNETTLGAAIKWKTLSRLLHVELKRRAWARLNNLW